MTFPIGGPPGLWGDPAGYTVTAADMHERVDQPLDAMYDLIQAARGAGATFSGQTPVASGTETSLKVETVTPFGDDTAVWSAGPGGTGLVLPGMGLYLMEVYVVLGAPWAGRCFVDIEASFNVTQRQPCVVNGTETQAENSGAILFGVDNLANNDFLTQSQVFHSTGTTRTATLYGRVFRVWKRANL